MAAEQRLEVLRLRHNLDWHIQDLETDWQWMKRQVLWGHRPVFNVLEDCSFSGAASR